MSVYRFTLLPEQPARGRLVVPAVVINDTARALRTFEGDGIEHEGLVYWAGRIVGDSTYVLSAIVPKSHHAPYKVTADELSVGVSAQHARKMRLGVIAQVHSHPGDDTRHSDGDDQLVLMPFEGMFSLVIGDYGRGGMTPNDGAGLHQFQDGRWIRVVPAMDVMVVVPSITDLRDE